MDKDEFLKTILHDIKKMAPLYEDINVAISKTSADCLARKAYRKLEYAYLAHILKIDKELKGDE